MSLVGVIGGGQLGRMLALAGIPLGLRFRFLDPSPEAVASGVGDLVVGSFDDERSLARFCEGLDALTFEFENIPASALRRASALLPGARVQPGGSLEVGQDRLEEKRLFARLGIPAPEFALVRTPEDVPGAIASLPEPRLPCVLKTRRLGYDGKGQRVPRTVEEAVQAARDLLAPSGGVPGSSEGLILERFVPLAREVSALVVRARDGSVAHYPLVENLHARGILRRSIAPARDAGCEPGTAFATIAHAARAHAERIARDLGHVGVLAVEFHVERDAHERLLANEIAPRVHNSGHWTIEGAETSQFENHLRAILDLPLGSTRAVGYSGMVNILGRDTPDHVLRTLMARPGVHVHRYSKRERPGRKLGHVNVRAPTESERDDLVRFVEDLVPPPD